MESGEALLLQLPTSLRGALVELRAYTDNDASAVTACVNASREHLLPWMTWPTLFDDPLHAQRYVRGMQAQWIKREDFVFGIWESVSGQLMGGCGLHDPDWKTPKLMIGYWVHPSAQGKGYVTEAVNLLTKFGFEHLHAQRLCISCDAANTRSAAVPPRAGYTQEAYLRNERRNMQGALSDTLMFGITRADYDEMIAAQP
ncbi:MAG: GNAT family N-acetyltransferase [Burkholderiaceae bacterium]